MTSPLRTDSAEAVAPADFGRPQIRWVLPAALLGGEYLALSLLVDFPLSGSALGLVNAVRLVVPVVIAAGAAGWLLARSLAAPVGARRLEPLPAWRPLPSLAAHAAAFVVTAFAALRLFGPREAQVTNPAMLVWLAGVLTTVLLAARSAAPLGWLGRLLAARWRVPMLALAAGLVTWAAAAGVERLWGTLSGITLRAVAWPLRVISDDVVLEVSSRVVGIDGFVVEVAPVCSGVDGVGLVVMFQTLWIAMARSRLRVGRALLLLPIGALAALAANVARITVLLVLGSVGHEALAMGGLHSKLGWLLFLAIALATVAVAERVPWLQRAGAAGASSAGGLPAAAAAYVAPLVAAVGTALVTGVFAAGFDRWYAARIAAAALALLLLRRLLPRLELSGTSVPLLVGAAVGILWIWLARGDGARLAEGLARAAAGERAAWIAARVLGSCLVIPVVEELAFRGFLLPWLMAPDFERVPARTWSVPALLLSSLAFGAIHPQWVVGTLAGLAFAAVRIHRGRLGDAVLAHAVANAAVAVAVLAAGRWDLWG